MFRLIGWCAKVQTDSRKSKSNTHKKRNVYSKKENEFLFVSPSSSSIRDENVYSTVVGCWNGLRFSHTNIAAATAESWYCAAGDIETDVHTHKAMSSSVPRISSVHTTKTQTPHRSWALRVSCTLCVPLHYLRVHYCAFVAVVVAVVLSLPRGHSCTNIRSACSEARIAWYAQWWGVHHLWAYVCVSRAQAARVVISRIWVMKSCAACAFCTREDDVATTGKNAECSNTSYITYQYNGIYILYTHIYNKNIV